MVIDVKEPARGPLGRADLSVWREVIETVGDEVPVSAALGELIELDPNMPLDWPGLSYRKLGLSHVGRDWRARWAETRARSPGTPWVAVIYADGSACGAPAASEILDEALSTPEIAGVLIDTFDKSASAPLVPESPGLIRAIQRTGRFVALAGGLDRAGIARRRFLAPDLFAVRGSACLGGRLGVVDESLVAELVRAAEVAHLV
jgi:hypothetical protein